MYQNMKQNTQTKQNKKKKKNKWKNLPHISFGNIIRSTEKMEILQEIAVVIWVLNLTHLEEGSSVEELPP